MQAAFAHAIECHGDYDIEYRIITPAGDQRWVSMRGQAIYGDKEQPLSMSGVSGDITDRKSAELRREAPRVAHRSDP